MITINLKSDLIEILNENIAKDSNIKSLAIYFANYQPVTASGAGQQQVIDNFEIKFHKYLKNLRSLSLVNVADKNFSDTMFDMASIRKLRELNLSFVPDLSLPGFSDALSKFTALHSLRLSTISSWGKKFNGPILLQYL